ncbi:uncharacterized protein LOC108829621 [Raphanus sativus]|uniref:Uncharacterized protein LOC108829621 n=1 Tax=Raphanus sativus TaxID=3726 RepID=A0A9W3DI17_RAPSA|nr:uncharacterized protein LOC108829621 [Raphanus sativus]
MGTMMEFPVFYGEDPEKWISWMDTFISAEGLSEFETRQLAYGFIDGEAHKWYCDEMTRSEFNSWEDLKFRLIQRFSTRSETEKAKLEWQRRLKQLDRLNEWLERRYPEKSIVEKQQKGSDEVPDSDLNQIPSQGGGSLKSIVPVPVAEQNQSMEQNQPMATSEVKDHLSTLRSEVPLLVSDPTKEVVVSEEAEAHTSLTNLFEKVPSIERKGNTRRKKKRWKEIYGICEINLGQLVNIAEQAEHERMKGKMRETQKDRNAYHVFDRMPLKRNEATEKSKKRKMKGTKPSNQNVNARRQYQRLNCRRLCLILVLNKRFHLGFMKKKKKLGLVEHDVLYGTLYLYLREKRVKMKNKRERFTKSKGWKHKGKEDKSETQRLQRESISTLRRKRVTKRRKRVSCVLVNTHQKVNRQWLLSFIKKKKGRMKLVYDKKSRKLFHTRDFEKPAGDGTVLKQSAKGKRMEFKRNHKKQNKWIRKLFSADLWSNQWLQLNVIVKLSGQRLLDVNKLRLYKKCAYENIYLKGDRWIQWYGLEMPNVKFFLPDITVRPLKYQGKQNKGSVKHDKMRRWKYKLGRMKLSINMLLISEKSTEQEMTSWMEGGKIEGRDKLDVLLLEMDITKVLLELQWLETLKNIEVNLRQQMENIDIQRRGLLGSMFLVEENDDIKSLKPVKKSILQSVKWLMTKHSFEPGNRVCEPGVIAGRQVGSDTGNKHFKSSICVAYNGKDSFSGRRITSFGERKEEPEALSNGVLEAGLGCFMSKLKTDFDTFKGARMIKLMRQQCLTGEVIAPDLLHGTYGMFHSPRPPEWLGIPCHDFKLWKSGSAKDCTFCFRFTTDLKLFSTRTGVCCSKVSIYEQREIEEKRYQFSPFNLEDKVDFKGGGIVTCTAIAVHG